MKLPEIKNVATRKPPKGHPTLREQVKPNSSQVELTSKWLAEAAKVMQDDRQDNNQKAQMKNLKTKLKRRKHARALPVYELENQRLKGLRKHQKKILAKPKAYVQTKLRYLFMMTQHAQVSCH